jgi:hypothetical protein
MKKISIAKFKISLSDELHVLFTNANANGIWNTEYTNKRKLQKSHKTFDLSFGNKTVEAAFLYSNLPLIERACRFMRITEARVKL